MSFNWKHYLDVADYLYSNCDCISKKEACLRAAISRGYYSAFCTARNYARDKDNFLVEGNRSLHARIIKFYRNSRGKSYKKKRGKVATELRRLKDLRNKADYEDSVGDAISYTRTAESAIITSRNVIHLLQEIYGV